MKDRNLTITVAGECGTGKTVMIALIQNMLFDMGLATNIVYTPEVFESDAMQETRNLIETRQRVREEKLTPNFWKSVTFKDLTYKRILEEGEDA